MGRISEVHPFPFRTKRRINHRVIGPMPEVGLVGRSKVTDLFGSIHFAVAPALHDGADLSHVSGAVTEWLDWIPLHLGQSNQLGQIVQCKLILMPTVPCSSGGKPGFRRAVEDGATPTLKRILKAAVGPEPRPMLRVEQSRHQARSRRLPYFGDATGRALVLVRRQMCRATSAGSSTLSFRYSSIRPTRYL